MTNRSNFATAIIAAALLTAGSSTAGAYSDRVQDNCKGDYLTFCSAHPVGSTGMRRCMEANGKNLSTKCINALVDAGEVPRKFARKQ